MHRALAAAADDPDCRARHRASSAMSPDEDVAAELERAAERAIECSGHGVAAVLYRQAPGFARREGRLGAVLSRVAAIEGDDARLRELIEHAPPPGGGFADCA